MLAVLLLSIVPQDVTLYDSVSLTECNHFYDENANLVFTQIIWWDWNGETYDVRAWRMLKEGMPGPERDWLRGGYKTSVVEQDFREIRSPHFRETWTTHDPELVARERLPKEQRRELNNR